MLKAQKVISLYGSVKNRIPGSQIMRISNILHNIVAPVIIN